jgi:hypothetical protein
VPDAASPTRAGRPTLMKDGSEQMEICRRGSVSRVGRNRTWRCSSPLAVTRPDLWLSPRGSRPPACWTVSPGPPDMRSTYLRTPPEPAIRLRVRWVGRHAATGPVQPERSGAAEASARLARTQQYAQSGTPCRVRRDIRISVRPLAAAERTGSPNQKTVRNGHPRRRVRTLRCRSPPPLGPPGRSRSRASGGFPCGSTGVGSPLRESLWPVFP